MELVPLGPGFGVEVKGVTMLDVATDAQAYKAVRQAFETHSLLVFRDQPIADDVQVAYSRAFGPLELTKVASLGANSFYSKLAKLKDAVATHSYANSRDQIHPDLANAEERKALPPVRWRLNWRNPANDRRALYVASHAYAIDGMDDAMPASSSTKMAPAAMVHCE